MGDPSRPRVFKKKTKNKKQKTKNKNSVCEKAGGISSLSLIVLLEEKEIVCGSNSNDVLLWMPCSVENLLVEIKAINGDFVLFPLSTGAHLSRFEHCLWLGDPH